MTSPNTIIDYVLHFGSFPMARKKASCNQNQGCHYFAWGSENLLRLHDLKVYYGIYTALEFQLETEPGLSFGGSCNSIPVDVVQYTYSVV